MISFKRLNVLVGWGCFLVAAFTYLRTQESSGSWWDCGEFMTGAYTLGVVHEPGSPLFLMLGKVFSVLAPSRTQVHILVNAVSSLSSAGTILFLFWTITLLAKRVLDNFKLLEENLKNGVILSAGILGALTYTFSDTFWFSAIESEVYALSSFFTAFVFWAILKWQDEAPKDQNYKAPNPDRWLIVIAYALGLSIGVHLLNLLALPAIVFVFYFKKFRPSLWGIFLTSIISVLVLALFLWGIIPYSLKIASWVDIFCVNTLKWPFNVGALGCIIILFILLFLALCFTRIKIFPIAHSIFLGLIFILLGYSSYFMVILRAQADPPLNNSNPNTILALKGYLAREQYEESPILWGPDYSSPISGTKSGEIEYRKGTIGYEVKGSKIEYTYAQGDTHFFPRLWSHEKAEDYASFLGLKPNQSPSFLDNLYFFWFYQLDHMYWRYFMWNFAGRQNDAPSSFPNPIRGNWISGIRPLDGLRLGNQSYLPSSIWKNKAYNRLYFFPLILGILGMIYQGRKSLKDFGGVGLLFLCTGFFLALYLNMPPGQPRERDYAFSGSFYAFSIWIGLGIIPIFGFLHSLLSSKASLFISTLLTFLAVPVWMGFQEWDDHDRSNRTVVLDFASNYLNSCARNAILFTYGDNETYPLWYAQQVEGVRTDIRILNLNLLDADWSIDKAKKKVNESNPLPISWKHDDYKDGIRDYMAVKSRPGQDYMPLKEALSFCLRTDAISKDEYGDNYFPSSRIKLKIDPKEVLDAHVVEPSEKEAIVSEMNWHFEKSTLSKGQIIILDIINQNHWKRPIYFCSTSGEENFLGLSSYLREEGITLRLVPIRKDPKTELNFPVNRRDMFNKVMHQFRWGNIKGGIHIDDQTNSFADSFKDVFMDLATALQEHKQLDSSLQVLNRESQVLPEILPPLGNLLGEEDFRLIHKAKLYASARAIAPLAQLLNLELDKIGEVILFIQSQEPQNLGYYQSTLKNGKSLWIAIEKLSTKKNLISVQSKLYGLKKKFSTLL